MSRPLVAITGASGFIGKALAERALRAGKQVRGLDLAPDPGGFYATQGGELLQGDVTDAAACEALCRGADTVMHTAAVVRERGAWSLFERINIGGTAAMLRAARREGVRRFVFFSSVMVHGFDYPDGVTEDGPKGGWDNPYCATKILSEELALAQNEPDVFDVFVIRPGDVYGPGSIPWTLRPTRMMQARQWVWIDSRQTLLNHVFIENLLDAVDLVVASGESGLPFTVTDDRRTSSRDFFGHYQRLLGIRWLPELSSGLAERGGAMLDRVASATGLELPLSSDAVRYMLRRGQYGIGRIKGLGYRPRKDLAEGMSETLGWLAAEGFGRSPRP